MDELTIIFIIILSITFVSVILIFIVLQALNNNKPAIFLKNYSYIIDFKEGIVSIVDFRGLNKVKKIALKTFYKLFDEADVHKLESFFNVILESRKDENKHIGELLELESKSNFNSKDYYFTILEVRGFKKEKSILYVDHLFYKNIPSRKIKNIKKLEYFKNVFDQNETKIEQSFKMTKNPFRGATFLFHLSFYLKNINTYKKTDIQYSFFNILCKYTKNIKILTIDKNSVLTFNFKNSSRTSFMIYIQNIKRDFELYKSINGLTNQVSLNISIIEHRYFPGDYLKILKTIKQLDNDTIDKKKPYVFYDNSTKLDFYFDNNYNSEIIQMITSHSFEYSFSPIVNIKEERFIGYYCHINPISEIFSSIDEIKKYAYKINYLKQLFMENMKYVVTKSYSEVSNTKSSFFVEISFNELEYCNSHLGYLNNVKEVNLVLIFDEYDILTNYTSNFINNKFEKLVAKGYVLALNISQQSNVFSDELYKLFSYFFYNSKQVKRKMQDNSQIEFIGRKTIEKVLKYKKPIIIKNVDTKTDLELRVQSGLSIFEGDVIGKRNQMFIPFDNKILKKIKKS